MILETYNAERLVWHKACFSICTDKGKLKRLQTPPALEPTAEASCGSDASSEACRTLRTGVEPVKWNLCIFCQAVNWKQRLISVMT